MNDRGDSSASDQIPLVGIGASAGGLEPLEHFFEAVDEVPDASFVVIQHLSPDHRSVMDELLGRRSNVKIMHIDDGLPLEPNTIYLNRPSSFVELVDEVFRVTPYSRHALPPHLPIDRFFHSLASRAPTKTIAVVLSGSGSDGSDGAQAVFNSGGVVLVQSLQDATFSSMPRAVLLRGTVDRILPASDMPEVIKDIFENGKKSPTVGAQPDDAASLTRILNLLELHHNIDFRNYKQANVHRRVFRRLQLRGFATLVEYESILSENAAALDELFHDMLIGVTEFYRDREAIASLRSHVLDPLASDTETATPIKIWVAACATGEEVYTIAIEMAEALAATGSTRKFRLIGTDIHSESIETASRGLYTEEKIASVPIELRDKYFNETSDGWVIVPTLRQKIIFSVHDLTNDPPFMNLDLVSCRNLLIYFEDEPQASAISMFIFGLMRDAHLFLGATETVGRFKATFEVIDARWRLFRKIEHRSSEAQSVIRQPKRTTSSTIAPILQNTVSRNTIQSQVSVVRSRDTLVRSYDALLKRYAPSSILLTMDGKVLNWFGEAGSCIDTMNNLADWTVQEIVHPDLHFAINVAVEKLRMGHEFNHTRTVRLNLSDKEPLDCLIDVEPLSAGNGTELVLVKMTFPAEETPSETKPTTVLTAGGDDAALLSGRVHSLERDLKLTEETLQHVTERLEASGEELQASNEELQASNEELQASNEELQSSNEELHAVNEELIIVSSEHERKIAMLSELNENLEVVLKLMNTGMLVLDSAFKIHRFTRLIQRNFLLEEHDIGRTLATVAPRLDFIDLLKAVETVTETEAPQVVSGSHEGRPLEVEARPIAIGSTSSRMRGTIILFRWT